MARTPPPDRRLDDDGNVDDGNDDAALRWDDVEDASWVEAPHSTASGRAAATADGGGSDTEALVEGEGALPGSRASGRASTLITALGAVVFAAYTVAWLIGIGGLTLTGPTFLLEVVYQFTEFLAIIASVLWFGATIVLTRGRPARRGAWLALGTLVLLPWPFVLGVIA